VGRSGHRSEELVRGILDAVPGGVVEVARDGSIRSANAEALRILGLRYDEVTARYVSDWTPETVHEDGSPCPAEDYPVSRVLRSGEPDGPSTIGIRRPDGGISWAVFRAVPLRDSEGRLDGVVVTFLDVTERKVEEERRRASEDRWRLLGENIPDFVAITDREGRILIVNGFVPFDRVPSVLGTLVFDHILEGDRTAYRARFEEALARGATTRAEARLLRTTGRERWFDIFFVPFLEADERRVLVVARDVSTQKEAENRLRASEQMWRSLAENIPDYALIADASGKILHLNRVRPGVTLDSVLGRSMYDYFDGRQKAILHDAIERALATRTTIEVETQATATDGSAMHFESSIVPLPDGDVLDRFLVVARDVTIRKRNEQQIRASEQRWKLLVDSLPDTVFVVDRDRRILSINEASGIHAAKPRYHLSEVLGMPADAFVDDAFADEWRRAFERVLETGVPLRLETRGRSAPGVLSWYESIMVPLADEIGEDGTKSTRVMVVARDITERRAMLAGLAEKERLASVGMVAASVAHEVMNPLTYVLANLELALGGRALDDARRTRALSDALEGAKRMQQIVWDLRSLGRAGGEDHFYVDPRSVLETALRLSGPEVGRTASVVLELGDVPGVLASESRLCQVFINLLVNAAQAMEDRPQADRRIVVRTRHDDAASLVGIAISDAGSGIPEDRLERIFEPFYTTKRSGTGLGLSISRDIIGRMGGKITVESSPGRGTTFTVWLSTTRPALRAPARATTPG
jgi:PAS domain S-box-containing protein